MRARCLREIDRRPRRRSEGDEGLELRQPDCLRLARRAHHVHGVIHHLLVHEQLGDRAPRGEDVLRLRHPLHLDGTTGGHTRHDLLLGVARRIPDAHLQHESVELGLGEGIGALLLDRVLGGEHEERLAEVEGLAPDRDLLLLHRLEQGRLDLGRSAVDLVGEHQVREQRALLGIELLRALIVHHRADHVRGQQVGGELDPRERDPQALRHGAHDERLGEPRHPLEQDVSAGQQADQQALDHHLLTDDAFRHFAPDGLRQRGVAGVLRPGGHRTANPAIAALRTAGSLSCE